MLVELVDRSAARRKHAATLQLAHTFEGLCFAAPKYQVEDVREVLRVDLELGEGFAPFVLREAFLPALSSG